MTKPRVVLFLGAGASAPFGYPTVMQFFNRMDELKIWETLIPGQTYSPLRATTEGFALQVHQFIGDNTPNPFPNSNAETLLGELDLLDRQLRLIRNNYKIPRLPDRHEFYTPAELLNYLKIGLIKVYSDESGEGDPDPKYRELLESLNSWGYLYPPLEIFTTNYDRIIEQIIPICIRQTTFAKKPEWQKAEIADGFLGQPRVWFGDITSTDKKILLYKLHGSVTWKLTNSQIVDIGISDPNPNSDHLLWFGYKQIPDTQPFNDLHNRLRSVLISDNVIFLVIGFQFGDPYIRDLFSSALSLNRKSKVVCCIKDIPQNSPVVQMQNDYPKQFSLVQAEFGSDDFIQKIQQYFP